MVYELRIYSMEPGSFGSVVRSRQVKAPHCITSIQFSPTSEHLLIAYGRCGGCGFSGDSGLSRSCNLCGNGRLLPGCKCVTAGSQPFRWQGRPAWPPTSGNAPLWLEWRALRPGRRSMLRRRGAFRSSHHPCARRRHLSLLRSLASDGRTLIPVHTILELYRVSDMSLVSVMPSAEDEVNAAAFSPLPVCGPENTCSSAIPRANEGD